MSLQCCYHRWRFLQSDWQLDIPDTKAITLNDKRTKSTMIHKCMSSIRVDAIEVPKP